ncbi:hypothetical protein ACFVVU_26565 [Kitasatospora sp. NPDC057965]|uniref:hypothetical protein n=1 Tax=Kitasatospora sp. NPDC057965 TaxID=3346291 RepID=UPI0036D7BAEC
MRQAALRQAGTGVHSVQRLRLLLVVPFFLAAVPAQAAGGSLNVSVEAVPGTVKSGEGASFRVQWTCSGSGTCDDAKISVPVPTALASSNAFPTPTPSPPVTGSP